MVSLGFIDICPKKNGFNKVNNTASKEMLLLNKKFRVKYNPSKLKTENKKLIECFISTMCFWNLKIFEMKIWNFLKI